MSFCDDKRILNLALEAANAAAWVWDVAGDMEWTERAYALFGMTPQAFKPTYDGDWLGPVHPEDRDRLDREKAEAIEQKRDLNIEYRVVLADGAVKWVNSIGEMVFDDSGRPVRMVGISIDVTERKKAEAERDAMIEKEQSARAEAEAANRAKHEFLAAVSHDLRSPLNAMLGWARILQSRKVDEATMLHALETIERSARKQTKLIENLLDTARIAQGKLRLSIQLVDLAGVIRAALRVAQPAADAKSIKLSSHLDAEAGFITGDPDRLQQVMWNLLSNAIKFTAEGGRVEVRLHRVGPRIQVVVSDTGCGISRERLPHVFDCFQQAGERDAGQHGGLRLGLSLVRHLIELHGGTVRAASAGPGLGSSFNLDLPVRAVQGAGTAEGGLISTSARSMNLSLSLSGLWLLVVDDEADARELITAVLEHYGAKVTAASSAAEAFTLLEDNPDRLPDMLISDISMPDEDGYSLIKRIRGLALERGGRIPAIALTAYSRDVDRERALSAGFQMHISKPVEPLDLARVILNLTGHAGRGVNA
jgi:PAS domain S-box-containing protein